MRRRRGGSALVWVSAAAALAAGGCPTGGDGGPLPGEVSFSRDVAPLLARSCADCHAPGGFADRSGSPLDLRASSSFDELVNRPSVVLADRVLVVPFDADASYLLEKVTSARPAAGERMPLFDAPLSSAEVALIRAWIEKGAPRD